MTSAAQADAIVRRLRAAGTLDPEPPITSNGQRAGSAESAGTSAAQTLSAPSALSAHAQDRPGGWPTLDLAARYGLVGEVVGALEPHTEADPAGLMLVFLAMFGNLIGPGPHAIADAAPHPARLYVALVGDTARARKGTAQAQANRLYAIAAPLWYSERVMGGLASGEGLIAAVRDKQGEEMSMAPADRRVMAVEPELARVLAAAAREGSTLSAILRQAWDDGNLRVMTRANPLLATGAHVSVIGHITREELARRLAEVEVANGFANRFLFCCVRRSKLLPHGGSLDPALLDHVADQVAAAVERAARLGVLRRTAAADALWEAAYRSWHENEPAGLAGAITARPDAQTLPLSVAYAALDGSPVIDRPHLEAALAVWRYAEQSALYLFGDRLGDEVADRLLLALRAAGEAGLDGTRQRELFSGHVSAKRLEAARRALEERGLAVTEREDTGGRPRVITRAAPR
jgi:hypothetical protein